MTAMNVGFVGLGAMGRGMAANLVRAGHAVQVWNRSPGPVAELVALGASEADGLETVFANDVVISILSDDAAVESVLLDPRLLEGAAATVHVNMATVSVELADRAAALHAEHGVGYLSAPVMGRSEVAAAGKLNIVAAGDGALIDHVEPLFAAMGQRTWRMGDTPHQANLVKIAGNFLIACAIESVAEACALAESRGIRSTGLVDLLTNTIFPGVIYSGYGSMVAERRYEPAGFRLSLGLKDVSLALSAGAGSNVPLPFGSVLRDSFVDAIAHGDADLDWAAVAEVIRRRAGLAAGNS
ncbi:NAD(P)-dependent oxidoreductase [Planotetraspora phitsanulokensis]|nr:NAD(P)-dependent oxidoreductase [Planotetraspora phitsanulokensis]